MTELKACPVPGCRTEDPKSTGPLELGADPLVWCRNKGCQLHGNAIPASAWEALLRPPLNLAKVWQKIEGSECPRTGTDLLVCWRDGGSWEYRACEVWDQQDWSLTGADSDRATHFKIQLPPSKEQL